MKNLILDGHKLFWHKERLNAWIAGERIAPITIDCALTRRCTYNCRYCYSKLQENDEKKLTKDVIFRFLDDAAEIGVKAVSLVSDGESTCSPHLYDAILRGKNNGLDMALGTNGYLLSHSGLQEILSALTYLRFNISAANRDRYAQIHGCSPVCFDKVIRTIRLCVAIKKYMNFPVTIGLQMVLIPEIFDQILQLAKLGKELGVDYFVIKHCSDSEDHSLGIDYSKYEILTNTLHEAELLSTDEYLVKVKWSKILSGGKRSYTQCYGPQFITQFSGSGLVAPCGMLFNSKYSKYHIGNIAEMSYKELWKSERYWQVMNLIHSKEFNAQTMCGSLCLQHKVNEFLSEVKRLNEYRFLDFESEKGIKPEHVNFI